MGGPIPSFASGLMDCTAWTTTWAAECLRMLSPSGESMVTGSTASASVTVVARSRSSPLTRIATTSRSGKRSNPDCWLLIPPTLAGRTDAACRCGASTGGVLLPPLDEAVDDGDQSDAEEYCAQHHAQGLPHAGAVFVAGRRHGRPDDEGDDSDESEYQQDRSDDNPAQPSRRLLRSLVAAHASTLIRQSAP